MSSSPETEQKIASSRTFDEDHPSSPQKDRPRIPGGSTSKGLEARMQCVSFPFQPPLRLRQIGVVACGWVRRSAPPRPPAAVEQVREGKDEARQDRTAVERLVRTDVGRLLDRRKDAGSAFPGIDQPDQYDAGAEVFLHLAGHLRLGVPLAEYFDGQVGRQVGDRLSGAF